MTRAALEIFYGANLDAAEWADRHARGEVPDVWPYGLHQLTGDLRPQRSHVAATRLDQRVARRLGGPWEWSARSRRSSDAFCWDERTGIPVATSARPERVITGVLWVTDDVPRLNGWSEKVARRALQRCAAVWASSAAQLEPLRRRFAIPDDRLHHVPFGVDTAFWTPGDETEPSIDDSILVVGNDRDRDHALAVRAAEQVQRRRANATLILCSRQTVNVPRSLGVRNPDVPHAQLLLRYRAAAVVAFATRPNLHCSGLTGVLEAMACGRAVVATDTPGMSDYVRHGVTGLLVPPGDAAAMAGAISSLLDDRAAAAAFGKAARASVEQRFTTRHMAARFDEILAQSLT